MENLVLRRMVAVALPWEKPVIVVVAGAADEDSPRTITTKGCCYNPRAAAGADPIEQPTRVHPPLPSLYVLLAEFRYGQQKQQHGPFQIFPLADNRRGGTAVEAMPLVQCF